MSIFYDSELECNYTGTRDANTEFKIYTWIIFWSEVRKSQEKKKNTTNEKSAK